MGPGVAGADLGYQAANQARLARATPWLCSAATRACTRDFAVCDEGNQDSAKLRLPNLDAARVRSDSKGRAPSQTCITHAEVLASVELC